MSTRPILVTGATGLLGNNLVRVLAADNRHVRALVRESADPRPLDALDVEVIRGDVTDPAAVRRACQGVSAVVHSAAYVQIGRRQLDRHRAVNVEGTRHVAHCAQAAGARLIHVSTCDCIGQGSAARPADEDTPLDRPARCSYLISKREAEQVVFDAIGKGLDAVIVNPGFMIGPWDWKPSSGRMLVEVGLGRGKLAPRGSASLCDVRDVAAAALAAVERGMTGRRYILAGRTMSYAQAWRLFARLTGVGGPWFTPGPLMLRAAGYAGDAWGRLKGCEPVVNSAAIAMAARPKYYSSRRAETELGYRIRPLEETVRDAWEWFNAHGYVRR